MTHASAGGGARPTEQPPHGDHLVEGHDGGLELLHGAPAVRHHLDGDGLHLWRRNALLSILGGSALHVTLATALAGG